MRPLRLLKRSVYLTELAPAYSPVPFSPIFIFDLARTRLDKVIIKKILANLSWLTLRLKLTSPYEPFLLGRLLCRGYRCLRLGLAYTLRDVLFEEAN